jgi:hypothetical protein
MVTITNAMSKGSAPIFKYSTVPARLIAAIVAR